MLTLIKRAVETIVISDRADFSARKIIRDRGGMTSLIKDQFSSVQFISLQSLSCVRLFATPWIAARQASLSITISGSSLKLMSIKSVIPSSHLILCRPLLLLPPIPPSIRAFSNESPLRMRWPKYWSFSFSIIPSKEHPGLISFRKDWLDLLAVQGVLKSLLQHHNIKASILRQLSLLHGPTLTSIHDWWKNHNFYYRNLCCQGSPYNGI